MPIFESAKERRFWEAVFTAATRVGVEDQDATGAYTFDAAVSYADRAVFALRERTGEMDKERSRD